MNTRTDKDLFMNTVLFPGESEEPLAVWTLAELYQDADLDSVRCARAYTDSPSPQWAG